MVSRRGEGKLVADGVVCGDGGFGCLVGVRPSTPGIPRFLCRSFLAALVRAPLRCTKGALVSSCVVLPSRLARRERGSWWGMGLFTLMGF